MPRVTDMLLRLPGWLASVLMIFFCAFWTYWGAGEMYHEGWWGAWYNRLPYLAPIAAMLVPTLIAFRFPLLGGLALVGIGVFSLGFFGGSVAYIGLAVAIVGAAFVFDGLVKRRARPDATSAPRASAWWRRHWREALALGLPTVILAAVSATMLPIVLSRVDDGDRGARLIEGNGVTLVWAPAGPGWNWKQSWGGYPSWQSIALYGVAPVGLGDKAGYRRQGEGYAEDGRYAGAEDMARTNLCRYLDVAGTTLGAAPQGIWRMPTTNEVVRSLSRHGSPAGCTWRGALGTQASCAILPDKESPLWATDVPVIYYWTADAPTNARGAFVAYNGTVNATFKLGGNPRHGYRCVREP